MILKNINKYNFKVKNDPKYIKWDYNLLKLLNKNETIKFSSEMLHTYLYRPFTKKWIYYDTNVVQRARKFKDIIISNNYPLLYMTGTGAKYFSVIASNMMVDKGLMSSGQGYFEYLKNDKTLFDNNIINLNTEILKKLGVTEDNYLFYIYALFHDKKYIEKYSNNLTKEVPRIPKLKNKDKYVGIGKKLINLHLNYEEVPAYKEVDIKYQGTSDYKVKKMKFAKKRNSEGKLEKDKSTIIFNDTITIENIPEKAYEYIVNGRSAIEWIMDQYQVKTDKKSGITDDPNDFSDDPKYIFNLLLSIINVSVQTVDLINQLPKLEIEE